MFGIEKPLHLKGIAGRKTESINSGVFEETPHIVTVMPRVRTYREKAKRSGIVDRSREKEEMRLATIRRLEDEKKLLESYITDHRLEFAGLPEIEPHVRDVFLTWLSRALENKNCRAKTEDGQVYHIDVYKRQIWKWIMLCCQKKLHCRMKSMRIYRQHIVRLN